MRKKIALFAFTLLVAGMMVNPVLAFGPSKAKNNKNLSVQTYDEETGSSQVWMWNQLTGDQMPDKPANGVFQEWIYNAETGMKFRLWRMDASRCNIGNAVVIPPGPMASLMTVYLNQPKWCYLNQTAYYSFLEKMPGLPQDIIAPWFPDGVYFRINVLGP